MRWTWPTLDGDARTGFMFKYRYGEGRQMVIFISETPVFVVVVVVSGSRRTESTRLES